MTTSWLAAHTLGIVIIGNVLLNPVLIGQTSPPDPVFVQIDAKLGKVVYHRVLKNETLYGISQIYGLHASSILSLNPSLRKSKKVLPPVVRIPISKQQVIYRLPLLRAKRDFVPIYYVARKQDNVFRISRSYFDMSTNLLTNRNDIVNNQIKVGQTLHIGWLRRQKMPLVIHSGRELPETIEPEISAEIDKFEAQFEQHQIVAKNEVAFWNTQGDGKGRFVMHRYAPTRSMIEITNPMYNTVAYAKVIGKLPSHLYAKEIDMVVSEELARALGVVDSKFFVQVRYQGKDLRASQ